MFELIPLILDRRYYEVVMRILVPEISGCIRMINSAIYIVILFKNVTFWKSERDFKAARLRTETVKCNFSEHGTFSHCNLIHSVPAETPTTTLCDKFWKIQEHVGANFVSWKRDSWLLRSLLSMVCFLNHCALSGTCSH